jgi:hypothetical protein
MVAMVSFIFAIAASTSAIDMINQKENRQTNLVILESV